MTSILGISGSIRKESFNTKLLQAASGCLPDGASLEIFTLKDIPLYNKDLDTADKPEPVQQLIDAIAGSDGLLVASPEYNYSVSGVLKNAIDWASRPAYKSVLAGKPAAIISGSAGPVGGARSQLHLRDVFSGTLTPVVPSQPLLVPTVQGKFNEDGTLADEHTIRGLTTYLADFVQWIERLA